MLATALVSEYMNDQLEEFREIIRAGLNENFDGTTTTQLRRAIEAIAAQQSIGLRGSIISFSGTINSAGNPIPTGSLTANTSYALCDGRTHTSPVDGATIVTPDLRDRFIVGSGSTYTTGNTGGSNFASLNTSQLPAHSHLTDGSGISEIHAVRAGSDGGLDGTSETASPDDAVYLSLIHI